MTVRKAGENPVDYVNITMSPVLVTSLSTGGSGGEDRLTENVYLEFCQGESQLYTPKRGWHRRCGHRSDLEYEKPTKRNRAVDKMAV